MTTTAGPANDQKAAVKSVYERIAAEYDDRIPGVTPVDSRFTETELEFVLGKVSASDSVLDIGCGTGRFTIPLAEKAARVTGLDLSAAMLEVAGRKASERGVRVELREGDMTALPFPDETFDVVVSMLALMHVPVDAREAVFTEVARVLKPGGRMVLGVKNQLFERMFKIDRFASVDVTDVDNKRLIFTNTRSGDQLEAVWHSFAPHDLERLFALSGMRLVHLRGNTPIAAWLADEIVAHAYPLVRALEDMLADVPPLNHLGYHLLAEGVKPLRGTR